MKKKILLHSCCAPCTVFPLKQLQENLSCDIDIIFFNQNIHPYREYKKRLASLREYLLELNIKLIIPEEYDFTQWFGSIMSNIDERCRLCYEFRLEYVFQYAASNSYDLVSSTLLYSKYQNHKCISDTMSKFSAKFQIDSYYEDFRVGWQEGIDVSLKKNMFRQTYCGCLFSEQERYDNRLKKRLKKIYKDKLLQKQ